MTDLLSTITKPYNNRIYSSTKLTPIEASLTKNEGYVYYNFLEKRKKRKPKVEDHHLVRTTDSRRTFSNGDIVNWSYKFYKITDIIKDTIPSYHNDKLPERYNEALLKITQLTVKKTIVL